MCNNQCIGDLIAFVWISHEMGEKMSQFNKRILVFCEGETERAYIAEWVKKFSVSHLVTVRVCPYNSPIGLLREGVKEYFWFKETESNPYDEVWLVFDRDSHPSFHQTLDMATKFPFIHLCWSNPCIEAWFLMHFKKLPNFPRHTEVLIDSSLEVDSENPYLKHQINDIELVANPESVFDTLKKHWKEYAKAKESYLSALQPKMEIALKNCLETDLHQDRFAFGSLMPELLNAITALHVEDPCEAEKLVGLAWHEHCRLQRTKSEQFEPLMIEHSESPTIPTSDVKTFTPEPLPVLSNNSNLWWNLF